MCRGNNFAVEGRGDKTCKCICHMTVCGCIILYARYCLISNDNLRVSCAKNYQCAVCSLSIYSSEIGTELVTEYNFITRSELNMKITNY